MADNDVMRKRPRTPKELAKDKLPKKGYSLFLEIDNMTALQEMADKWKLSASELVDEAIRHYLSAIATENDPKPSD